MSTRKLEPLFYSNGKPVKFPLHKPIESMGDKLTELTFYREPTAGDFAKGDGKGEHGSAIILIAGCTLTTPEELGELSARDYMKAAEILGWFCGTGDEPAEGRPRKENGDSAGTGGEPPAR